MPNPLIPLILLILLLMLGLFWTQNPKFKNKFMRVRIHHLDGRIVYQTMLVPRNCNLGIDRTHPLKFLVGYNVDDPNSPIIIAYKVKSFNIIFEL